MSHPTSVAEWLTTVGLPEYAVRFAENDIDLSVLVHLTDQDLKELGHRRKLLAGIAELPGAVRAGSHSAPSGPMRHDDAERRQLSIMFCDLVGSTTLSTHSISRTCARSSGRITDVARS